MKRKNWCVLFIAILFLYFGISVASLAAEQLEVKAPHGGEFDLAKNVMKYYGTVSRLVEARWRDLEAINNETVDKNTKSIKKSPTIRILKSVEMQINLNSNFLVADKNVVFLYDEGTSATCNNLEWDRPAGFVKLSGQVIIKYLDWVIKGSRVEGELGKGLFTVYGPVEAVNPNNTIRGNKLVLDRPANKGVISGDAVLIRDQNEMTAPEITYSFDTHQVLASGVVRTKIINETK
jgi:lipopolysaccharide export system protein LptA